MFTWKATGQAGGGIDSVACMEGQFKWPPDSLHREVNLILVYLNSKTGNTYGSAKVDMGILSQDTLESLEVFMRLAERDFGRIASGQETVEDRYGENPAAVTTGLKIPTLGGE